jgi:nucleotide-binding universal stress UspA family protein
VVLIATGGKRVDAARLRDEHPAATFDERSPVTALQDHSRDVGLIVLGSRGLHGLRAVGSVSERVAHRAACSVLVTRGLRLGNGGGRA